MRNIKNSPGNGPKSTKGPKKPRLGGKQIKKASGDTVFGGHEAKKDSFVKTGRPKNERAEVLGPAWWERRIVKQVRGQKRDGRTTRNAGVGRKAQDEKKNCPWR